MDSSSRCVIRLKHFLRLLSNRRLSKQQSFSANENAVMAARERRPMRIELHPVLQE